MINTYSHNPEQLLGYAQGHTEAHVAGLEIGLEIAEKNLPERFSDYSIEFDTYAAEKALHQYIDEAEPEIFDKYNGEDWSAWCAGADVGIEYVLKRERSKIRYFDHRGEPVYV